MRGFGMASALIEGGGNRSRTTNDQPGNRRFQLDSNSMAVCPSARHPRGMSSADAHWDDRRLTRDFGSVHEPQARHRSLGNGEQQGSVAGPASTDHAVEGANRTHAAENIAFRSRQREEGTIILDGRRARILYDDVHANGRDVIAGTRTPRDAGDGQRAIPEHHLRSVIPTAGSLGNDHRPRTRTRRPADRFCGDLVRRERGRWTRARPGGAARAHEHRARQDEHRPMPDQNDDAPKDVMEAVPAWVRKRSPAKPEVRLVSVALNIQLPGSEPDAGHTLALNVEPTTRK